MPLQILSLRNRHNLRQLFTELRVDPYGIEIMLPKALDYIVRVRGVSRIAATILKQEMLSLGAETAVPRGTLTGKAGKTDCLLIGTKAHLTALTRKLSVQPFGLAALGRELSEAIARFEREDFVLRLPRQNLRLGTHPLIMGIINVTPDSFSGDGLSGPRTTDAAVELALRMVEQGADILDIGGESTRPNAHPVPLKEELARVIPAVRAIAQCCKTPLSVDTYKPAVAAAALDNGASIINDITGLRNSRMRSQIARARAAAVIMHMQGKPATMQRQPAYRSVTEEISAFFSTALDRARESGISDDSLIVDPGIGFGKTVEHNLEILARLDEFKILGKPMLVGLSRKSFIGKILGTDVDNRLIGSIAGCVSAALSGAHIVRVHDVKETKQALLLTQAIIQTKRFENS